MAYYLMIEKRTKNKSIYEPIDISSSPCFTRFSIHKGDMYTLQELDYFTMMFNNQKELIRHLVKNNIIDMNSSRKSISIRHKSKGEFKKVPYNFLYQEDIEYIVNPEAIIRKIENKLYQEDYKFLANLANRYIGDHYCGNTAFNVRLHASDSITNNYAKKYLYRQDENRDILVVRLIKLIIYKNYQNEQGYIVYKKDENGKLIIDYRRLHDLVAYISYTEKKENKLNSEEKNQSLNENNNFEYSESIFDIAKREENGEPEEYKYTIKKRTLKKDNYIDGQYSLF